MGKCGNEDKLEAIIQLRNNGDLYWDCGDESGQNLYVYFEDGAKRNRFDG